MNPTIAAHEALPSVGLHGLALAGYPPRRWAAHREGVSGWTDGNSLILHIENMLSATR